MGPMCQVELLCRKQRPSNEKYQCSSLALAMMPNSAITRSSWPKEQPLCCGKVADACSHVETRQATGEAEQNLCQPRLICQNSANGLVVFHQTTLSQIEDSVNGLLA